MARVLAIEDDPDLQEVLRYNLGAAKHEVHLATTGSEGLRIAREQQPDLVLLDLMLPDMPGTSVCKRLKADPATRDARVIIVSAKGEEIDRVVGFELGADDYVVKPFSVRELLLRIEAVMRRAQAPQPETLVVFGSLRFDRDAHRVWVDEGEVLLTAIELQLLVTLYDGQNRVRSREDLLLDVWGGDSEIDVRTVDTHVKRLREKLGRAGAYVETVRGVGYRFAAEHDE
jgi:two-component system phosphate regulon response regulator PhoB